MAKEKATKEVSEDPKAKARATALAEIHKKHGKESIRKYSDMSHAAIEVVPSGSIGLDIALGIGGYPRGRIMEIVGFESVGKTTMMLHAIAECQKLGGTAAFIDAEHALDPAYAANLGVDMDSLYLSQPDNGEQALGIVEDLVRSNGFDMIMVDSVAALVPKSEIDGEMGDAQMGAHARLMSQALRKLAGITAQSKTILWFANQWRSKIGVVYGSPNVCTGGNALKFYASVRMEIKRVKAIKVGEETVGNRTSITVIKNKVAPPFKKAEFDIMFGRGVNRDGELFDYGVTLGIIEKSGAWYSYNGEKVGQGRDNSLVTITSDSEMLNSIEKEVYKRLHAGKLKGVLSSTAPASEPEEAPPEE